MKAKSETVRHIYYVDIGDIPKEKTKLILEEIRQKFLFEPVTPDVTMIEKE